MGGSIAAAIAVCKMPEVGGFANLMTHERVAAKLSLLPDLATPDAYIPLLVIPLGVQWWSSWYPGAEPGGGGYVAQRMLASRNETHATLATLLFAIAHYALRPWPWIVVALASLVVFPDLNSIRSAFPEISESIIRDDLAYPAMITLLPSGLLGVVLASLVAAFMSTLSTHLNWGSSYVTHDAYRRFINPRATEHQLVRVGRWSTFVLMIISSALSLMLSSALDAFHIILQIGAGTGLIFLLRWFWWRINAYTEIAGMTVSFLVAIYLQAVHPLTGLPTLEEWHKLLVGVGVTTVAWVLATFLTPATSAQTLENFYQRVRPSGPGWRPVQNDLAIKGVHVPTSNILLNEIAAVLATTCLVYGLLFGAGCFLYGMLREGIIYFVAACACALLTLWLWPKLGMDRSDDLCSS
jgi:Na+/proline symporter